MITHYVATGGDQLQRLLEPPARLRARERPQGDAAGARAVNYRVADQIIHDDRPLIVLYNQTTLAAYNTNVSGITLDYKGQVQLANAQFR